MTPDQPTDIHNPAIKAASAIAAAGFAGLTWNEIAAILAAFYTLLLICEWVWKRVIKPMALTRGWIKPKLITEDTE
jgi:hypothetical protein